MSRKSEPDDVTRRQLTLGLAAISFAATAATRSGTAGAAEPAPAAVRSELAPGGTLRAGMNLGNALFTTRDRASGELRGVAVDVLRELASRLGVPVQFVVHEMPGDVADAATTGTWDAAILAIEATRARTLTFSPAMTEIAATYAVHRDSPLQRVEQVDAPGVRIAASEKAGYELFLSGALKHATLVRVRGVPAAIDTFVQGRADAVAGLEPALIDAKASMPDARLLPGSFMTVNHGICTPAGRPAAATWIAGVVDGLNRSGFVARSIAHHGVRGLSAVKS